MIEVGMALLWSVIKVIIFVYTVLGVVLVGAILLAWGTFSLYWYLDGKRG